MVETFRPVDLQAATAELPLVQGAMPVFFKVKGINNYALTFTRPIEAQAKAWENEHPRKGGFTGPADVVANAMTGVTFDEFVGEQCRRNRLWQDSRTQRAFLQNDTFKVGFFIRVIELLTGDT
jgi:hypothetical protein